MHEHVRYELPCIEVSPKRPKCEICREDLKNRDTPKSKWSEEHVKQQPDGDVADQQPLDDGGEKMEAPKKTRPVVRTGRCRL